jgi:nucleotide-binding universal stress UspA family protein
MNRILIALDYAPAAREVAEKSFKIAKAMNAEIYLMHVVEDIIYYSSTVYNPIMGFGGFVNTDFIGEQALHNVKVEALQFLEKTKLHLKDTNIETRVICGAISDSILETARVEKCNLIAVGTHSRRGFDELLMGNTATYLIKHSLIPLLIIPIKPKHHES